MRFIITVFILSVILTGCSDENLPQITAPVVATLPTKEIKLETAVGGGEIVSDGGSDIIRRGIVWSNTPGPTIGKSNRTFESGSSLIFTSLIDSLSHDSKYYFRAYAINSAGTSYGEEVTFTTPTVQLGDEYKGGIVFHTAGRSGLVAALVNQGEFEWGCMNIAIGQTSSDIGRGLINSLRIESVCGESATAVNACLGLRLNGYTDWFLPSRDELNKMYRELFLNGLGNIENGFYWSSTEGTLDGTARFKVFGGSGIELEDYRVTRPKKVRAVRAFY